ncbi:hypothetical protein FQZ97_542650 [compost metagenome]
MKAMSTMPRPSSLTKLTPSASNRAQAALMSGTAKQIWSKPRGSALPMCYWPPSSSVRQLWVSSSTPERLND